MNRCDVCQTTEELTTYIDPDSATGHVYWVLCPVCMTMAVFEERMAE